MWACSARQRTAGEDARKPWMEKRRVEEQGRRRNEFVLTGRKVPESRREEGCMSTEGTRPKDRDDGMKSGSLANWTMTEEIAGQEEGEEGRGDHPDDGQGPRGTS